MLTSMCACIRIYCNFLNCMQFTDLFISPDFLACVLTFCVYLYMYAFSAFLSCVRAWVRTHSHTCLLCVCILACFQTSLDSYMYPFLLVCLLYVPACILLQIISTLVNFCALFAYSHSYILTCLLACIFIFHR